MSCASPYESTVGYIHHLHLAKKPRIRSQFTIFHVVVVTVYFCRG